MPFVSSPRYSLSGCARGNLRQRRLHDRHGHLALRHERRLRACGKLGPRVRSMMESRKPSRVARSKPTLASSPPALPNPTVAARRTPLSAIRSAARTAPPCSPPARTTEPARGARTPTKRWQASPSTTQPSQLSPPPHDPKFEVQIAPAQLHVDNALAAGIRVMDEPMRPRVRPGELRCRAWRQRAKAASTMQRERVGFLHRSVRSPRPPAQTPGPDSRAANRLRSTQKRSSLTPFATPPTKTSARGHVAAVGDARRHLVAQRQTSSSSSRARAPLAR